jgi:HIV Tat-specific factor 1
LKFQSALHAEECVNVMNGRFFDGRTLKAEYWDGKTDYRIVRESKEELERRIDEFGKWLDGEEEQEEDEN